jgi:hypothetical protein
MKKESEAFRRNKLDPRLEKLLDKEGNTEAEIEWIRNHVQVKDVQNVGFGNSVHPNFEQINIIVENIFDKDNDEIYHNYLIKEVAEIKAFKCPDGAIFEDEEEAKKHTKDYHLRKKLEKFCDENCTYGMNGSDVLNTLLENLDELKTIFGGK